MIEQNLILILVLLPFLAAIAAATLPVNSHGAAAWVSGLSLAGGLVILITLYPQVSEDEVVRSLVRWLPILSINLNFRMDGFAWMFTFIVLSIGILVVIYARFYLAKTDPVPRFYSFLMAFTGAMVGMLLSGNILMLVVFWELTSIMSFLLIGYWHQSQSARDGARMALIVTAGGGVALTVAMLVLGQIVGGYDLDLVLRSGEIIRNHALYPLVLVLFLIGAFTKSAQFPFHFWLPGAMAAPTPVSAYLHSATMVKMGVFLLIRFQPSLGATDLWFWLVGGIGMLTFTLGAVIALFRHDLKGMLAYSTISHLGLITALAGMGSEAAIIAAIFHIVNHAAFKASLFMTAGIIDHETGTRDLRKLSGLRKALPVTFVLTVIASAAMAGVPLLNGFISKEMFLAETIASHGGNILDNALPWIAAFASVFSVAYSLRLVMEVFFGPEAQNLPNEHVHEPKHWMRFPVELLVAVCVIIGVLPWLADPILNVAGRAVLGPDMAVARVAIWHGFNTPLMISLFALAAGTALWVTARGRINAGPEGPPVLYRIRAQKVYEWLLLRLTWVWPRALHRLFGTERLQTQLRLLVVLGICAAAVAIWGGLAPAEKRIGNDLNPAFAIMWLVGGACAIGAAWQAKYHRFAALVLLGGAGLITCVTFAWFSAPDLAVTQLVVEIVTTVLLLLGLRWLPKRREEIAGDDLLIAKARRGRDLIIAAIGGGGLAALAWVVMTRPLVPNIGDWFLRNAYYEGGGTNTVNVILVDFRAFDTYGEITVLAIVGLTVYALLRRFRPGSESISAPEQQQGYAADRLENFILIPSVIMRWMFPVTLVIAAYLFLRGHDLPGGGFSAGVTVAIGLLLQYIGSNVRWIEARIIILPIRWMGIGLLIATATGIGAWLFGYPFLTAHARYLDIPLIGKVPMATAMLFDLGVFLAVVGATVLLLIAIAHQSLRAARLRELEEEKAEEKATKQKGAA
ncbi:monovalent cation/H+ antiporter subunit A [Pseudogemmobacter bohemicus]|uniref:monovalent cation/H+ antiporter subunit A n=1 Tax=Pseudogemmobacter bohemicus TaxID=2250708 RepID=UPI000DD324B2|nr:monovalent cation/H+ antiporter subunit A [Pseudogemmobacter bohemicus]